MGLNDDVARWLYRGGSPNQIARVINGTWARVFSTGLVGSRQAMLSVTGRRSGRAITLPVVVADVDGQRYLVSMLGPKASWVRNLDAAGGRATLTSGQRREIALEPVAVERRAPILKRYLKVAPGARAHFPVSKDASLSAFNEIASNYPVYLIVETDGG